MLDEMFQRNASKFAIFLEYKNLCRFFFFILCYFIFFPNECPGLCRHRPRHSLGKIIKKHQMKKKTAWVFVFQKYGKFCSISLDNFLQKNPHISEELQHKNQKRNSSYTLNYIIMLEARILIIIKIQESRENKKK